MCRGGVLHRKWAKADEFEVEKIMNRIIFLLLKIENGSHRRKEENWTKVCSSVWPVRQRFISLLAEGYLVGCTQAVRSTWMLAQLAQPWKWETKAQTSGTSSCYKLARSKVITMWYFIFLPLTANEAPGPVGVRQFTFIRSKWLSFLFFVCVYCKSRNHDHDWQPPVSWRQYYRGH